MNIFLYQKWQVQDLFGEIDKTRAAELGKRYLEELPDINFLKPVVWAQHKDMPEFFGVSLGVRKFVRPLFLYYKLQNLRNVPNDSNDVELKDVEAFETAVNRELLLKTESPARNENNEYNNPKSPCQSCLVFFCCRKLTPKELQRPPTFPPFGNCAEYDVIRTSKLNSVLRDLQYNTEHWALFESACEAHVEEFKKLSVSGTSANPREEIEKYYKSTGNAKVLKYQKIRPTFDCQFRLVAKDWRPKKARAKKTQNKRTKTK